MRRSPNFTVIHSCLLVHVDGKRGTSFILPCSRGGDTSRGRQKRPWLVTKVAAGGKGVQGTGVWASLGSASGAMPPRLTCAFARGWVSRPTPSVRDAKILRLDVVCCRPSWCSPGRRSVPCFFSMHLDCVHPRIRRGVQHAHCESPRRQRTPSLLVACL